MTKRKAEKQPNPTWGKMLTREQLLALLDRIDQKKKEREMSKVSDTLKRALEKKQGKTHLEGDAAATTDKKVKKAVPVITGRPMKKAAGRGR